jgi:hypothetical protein
MVFTPAGVGATSSQITPVAQPLAGGAADIRPTAPTRPRTEIHGLHWPGIRCCRWFGKGGSLGFWVRCLLQPLILIIHVCCLGICIRFGFLDYLGAGGFMPIPITPL